MTLAPGELHILQHALGADEYGRWPKGHDWYYRDYYIGEDATADALVEAGLMKKFDGNAATGGDCCYRVTGNGIVAMRQASPEPPKLTKSQQRYRDFLAADLGISFREWLNICSR